ncbi:MAG: membrane protein insertion efficiency factor YidD [Chloroflexi bacterium RBG_16_48_8]|nr:MAG: membrane protein insertion efficiency factor YidD [Chloroflexi bacterium RBG_16_48_8]
MPLSWRNFPQFVVLAFIRLYQLTISRILPSGTCRFYPTCSHFGFQAIAKYGLIRGGWMAFKRILRCQPFHPGGYDPVP